MSKTNNPMIKSKSTIQPLTPGHLKVRILLIVLEKVVWLWLLVLHVMYLVFVFIFSRRNCDGDREQRVGLVARGQWRGSEQLPQTPSPTYVPPASKVEKWEIENEKKIMKYVWQAYKVHHWAKGSAKNSWRTETNRARKIFLSYLWFNGL